MDDFLSGEWLDDKYLIELLLGQGGMGAVYKAAHLGTTRTVAIKIIRRQLSSNQEFVERFRREPRRPDGCAIPTSSTSPILASRGPVQVRSRIW